MSSRDASKPSIAASGWRARRSLVATGAGIELPVEIRSDGSDGPAWVGAHAAELRERLLDHGAVLLRGLRGVNGPAGLASVMRAVAGELLEYGERSSPRRELGAGVYTSTEYPADQAIALHNESSYAATFPAVIGFACAEAPTTGGETPLADCRRVLARLSTATRDRFERDGVLYVRRHGTGIGLDWRVVVGTDDRDEAERRLRAAGYHTRWDGDRLETRRIGPSVVRHASRATDAWFNHAVFFHISTLPEPVARALMTELGEHGLPNQTYHGDGEPIAMATLDEIRHAYRDEMVAFRWCRGDVLLVDNLSVAHGRAPFQGGRRILVAMSRPCRTVGDGGWRRIEAVG